MTTETNNDPLNHPVHDSEGFRYQNFADYVAGIKENCEYNETVAVLRKNYSHHEVIFWIDIYKAYKNRNHYASHDLAANYANTCLTFLIASNEEHARKREGTGRVSLADSLEAAAHPIYAEDQPEIPRGLGPS